MRKKLHLHIPSPCHEEWADMKPVDDGRFCLSCQKSVVDFTLMSDAEIINFFKKPSTGSVCGRFQGDQLNRDIQLPRKSLPWIKYFFQFTLPAFLISMKADAQKGKPQIITEIVKDNQVLGKIAATALEEQSSDTVAINGRIEEEKGIPIAGAHITVKGTNRGAASGVGGNFSIKIRKDTFPVVLIASSVGFQSVEKTIKIDETEFSRLSITMKLQPQLSGEVIIAGGYVSKKQKISKRDKITCEKSESTPLLTRLFKDILFKRFSIYPNPVKGGQFVTIENKNLIDNNYFVEIINLAGQAVHNEIVAINGKQGVYLKIPVLSAGTYFLRLIGKGTGKIFSEKIIVE